MKIAHGHPLHRRDFLCQAALAGTALAAAGVVKAADAPAAGALPTGRIGDLNVTRLILGGNLLTRYHHSRDLGYVGKLVRSYNTDGKIRETIELAEARGINTLSVNVTPGVMKILGDHRKNGGKIQTILYSTADIENPARYGEDIRIMTDFGSEAIYIWGVHADRYATTGRLEVLSKVVADVQARGTPCGMGGHDLKVVQAVEKAGLPIDFYIKTLHHHRYPTAPRTGEASKITAEVPGYWCRNPEETVATMQGVAKPWIAFKVMAAGAIPPGDAFPYAFNSGADFVLAGMFDFDIEEDCRIARDAVASAQKRNRPWRA